MLCNQELTAIVSAIAYASVSDPTVSIFSSYGNRQWQKPMVNVQKITKQEYAD